MRVVQRIEGKVALINRLIAAFHGSGTLKKLFSYLPQATNLSFAAKFRIENTSCTQKAIRAFDSESIRFSITLEKHLCFTDSLGKSRKKMLSNFLCIITNKVIINIFF